MSNAVEQIKIIIDDNQNETKDFKNFVLQGGAGSGKTESLKEVILYISEKYPNKKIACITLTNAAVDEMKLRIGNNHVISTIHSFLSNLIKNYKKNLSKVIHNIFCISLITIEDHENYKKLYKEYSNKLLSFKNEKTEQVISKREYTAQSNTSNNLLNQKIIILNDYIKEKIDKFDYNNITYNETRFDSFKELSFSHDSLLILANRLCKEFDLLAKIITDKYDFIFIDEYQDTNEEVIDIFLNLLPKNRKTTIGLFGDSMQGIYENGIGNVETHIENGQLIKVDKEDNYRCSKEVISFINTIREDSIKQKVALKLQETESSRNGKVQFYYHIYDSKPNVFSSEESKNLYLEKLDDVIEKVQLKQEYIDKKYKILMLTNSSISKRIGFNNIFSIFSNRYIEIKEEIEKELARIQISDIVDMCRAYKNKEYNYLLVKLKKNNFQIKSIADKKRVSGYFDFLLDKDLSLTSALTYSFENGLIKKSEQYKNYLKKRDNFLGEFESNEDYKNFEKHYKEGNNTRKRLKDNNEIDITEEEFDLFQKSLKKKNFYTDLFSDNLKFQEAINYFNYLNEETEYITLHKTKGTGIDNVILVLDEYFWNKYNFKSIYDNNTDVDKTLKNKKIFYVACSRTINNLAIIRLIQSNEEELVKEYFKDCEIEKIE